MALNEKAVLTAAVGYVFTAPVGTAAPTPAELEALDPELFGAQVLSVKVTGVSDFTLKIGSESTVSLDVAATPAEVQAALEALASVGNGGVLVAASTDPLLDYEVTVAGPLLGKTLNLTSTGATIEVKTPPNGWVNVGHTSRDDLPEFGFDGGDYEIRGTWQRKNLREVLSADPVADSVSVSLEQFDPAALELYYGPDVANTPGVFGVSGEFTPAERAFLVIIVDGTAKIGFYASKASIRRDDAIELPLDDFAKLPIKATFLHTAGRRLFDWISEVLF